MEDHLIPLFRKTKKKNIKRTIDELTIIIGFNRVILSELEERCGNFELNENQKISDVFIKIAPFLKSYISYIITYDEIREFIEGIVKKLGKPTLPFNSGLVLPIQRLPRYSLLLEELLKHTSKVHPDYSDLHVALSEIQKCVTFLNERKRESEECAKIVEIQDKIDNLPQNLAVPGRYFIKQVHSPHSETTGFCFNDVCIFCHVKSRPFKSKQYAFKKAVAYVKKS